MRRRLNRLGPPSARLAGLIEGDLAGFRREAGVGGRVRFVPVGDGPVIEVGSRIEKRFLGRTEIAVFEAELDGSLPEESIIALKHTGALKRSGVTAVAVEGGDAAQSVAEALASDQKLAEALLPLDFTSFELHGNAAGCRARVELMGASHVAVALPPIRSYIHLHPDQREAMVTGIEEAARILRET